MGSDFGLNSTSIQITIHGLSCTLISLISSTQVSCAVPWILPGNYSIYVTVSSVASNYFPIQITGLPGFLKIELMRLSLSQHNAIYVAERALVYMWGYNIYGQLGLGHSSTVGDQTADFSLIKTNIIGPNSHISSMSGGGGGDYSDSGHSCVLYSSGSVACFGSNGNGQLGIGSTTNIGDNPGEMPPPLINIGGFVSIITAAQFHTCAWLSLNFLKCWGYNYYGQLGQGDTTNRISPVSVNIGSGLIVAEIALGDQTCIRITSGSLKCWGRGDYGQLGNGGTSNIGNDAGEMPPNQINIGGSAIQIAAGDLHTCAILSSITLKCWGNNANGQIGVGNTDNQLTPVIVSLGTTVPIFRVVCGGWHTCALFANGEVKCWGLNSNGF
jgi:alpha-tubulin suppressor-like RCC1 family protein